MNDDYKYLALEYPFDIISESCLFRNGKVEPLEPFCEDCIIDDYICRYLPKEKVNSFQSSIQPAPPILTYASNAAPSQLIRKLTKQGKDATILILKAVLHDFDVVYSAHITDYGAIPATLHYLPGLETSVYVLFLEPETLTHFHATEGAGTAYQFVHLWDIRLQIEQWPQYFEAYTYLSIPGPLEIDNKAVSLSKIQSRGLRGMSMSEKEIQSWLYEKMHGNQPTDNQLERFVLEQCGEEGEQNRNHRISLLRQFAGKFKYSRYDIILQRDKELKG